MEPFGIVLVTAAFAFFAVLPMKMAYFRFVVEKMLRDANADWRGESGMWNETKQVHALSRACPDARTVGRNATLLFRATVLLFLVPIIVLVVGFILGV